MKNSAAQIKTFAKEHPRVTIALLAMALLNAESVTAIVLVVLTMGIPSFAAFKIVQMLVNKFGPRATVTPMVAPTRQMDQVPVAGRVMD